MEDSQEDCKSLSFIQWLYKSVRTESAKLQIHVHKHLLRVNGILEAYHGMYWVVLKNREPFSYEIELWDVFLGFSWLFLVPRSWQDSYSLEIISLTNHFQTYWSYCEIKNFFI